MFGKIYEYFLSNFALSEGQGGGEFFTPRSVVKLMVEIIEPHGGKVYDPACGSGGMFVQSAEFIAAHREDVARERKEGASALATSDDGIYVYGQEKTLETVKLAKMNLAVNGLHGSVIQANTYAEDPHGKLDERILFIDARNVFTQIDRAHREFSDEQVANIAIISQLHKGRRDRFVALVDHYFAQGVASLHAHAASVEALCAQLFEALDDPAQRQSAVDLKKQWKTLAKLEDRYATYLDSMASTRTVLDAHNTAQHKLHAAFAPFFAALHAGLKALDKTLRQLEKQQLDAAQTEGKRGTTERKTKALKTALDTLHAEVKDTEAWFAHIQWLQERFPKAQYDDVTGLCKLATRAEVAEQDWSLNPGRYVGVVIEEDGKTEAEFISGLLAMNAELATLNAAARVLEDVIAGNVALLAGEE